MCPLSISELAIKAARMSVRPILSPTCDIHGGNIYDALKSPPSRARAQQDRLRLTVFERKGIFSHT